MSKKPVLLLPQTYVDDATEAIKRAKHRVSFTCMMISDDEVTDEFIDALNEAAKRSVHVEVAADTFTYGELSGHFIPTRYFTKKARETTHMARQFKQSNVHFNWLGRFSNTPFTGRTHIKWCVVDDTIYSFGGVNLYDKGIGNIDYMFRLKDSELARALDDEYDRLVRADKGRFSYRSRSIETTYGSVHIDGGLPLDSIIYRRACTLARDASSVLYVSQFGPAGKLNYILRRTPSQLYFNTGNNVSGLSKFVIRITELLTGNKTLYSRQTYLHAKFMIFTMPDGTKIALTGSHNFSNGGVILGTREIALETRNIDIIKQLESFHRNHVA